MAEGTFAAVFHRCFPRDVTLSHSCLKVEHTLSAIVSLALIGTGGLGIASAVHALARADETHNTSHRHMAVQMWLLSAYLIVLSLLSLLGAIRTPKRLLYMFNCLQSFFFRGALQICIGSSVVILALQGGVGIPTEVFVPQPVAPITASPIADDGSASVVIGAALADAAVSAARDAVAACGYARVDTSVGSEYVRYWCLGVGGAAVLMGCVVCVLGCPCFALPGPRSLEELDGAINDHIAFGAVDSGLYGGTGADTERANLLSRRITALGGYQSAAAGEDAFGRAAPLTTTSRSGTAGPSSGSLRAGGPARKPPAGVGTPSGVSGAVDVVDPIDSDVSGGISGTQLTGFRSPPGTGAAAGAVDSPLTGDSTPAPGAVGAAPLVHLPSAAQPTVRTTSSADSTSGSERASPVGDGGPGSRYGTPLAHAPPPQRTPSALPGAGLGAAAGHGVASAARPGSAARPPTATGGRPLPVHLQPDAAPVDNPFGDADDLL